MTLAEFHDYLRTVNSREGRPYADATMSAYIFSVKALDAWLSANGTDGDFSSVNTALLNLTIPGSGNTISLTLGALQLG